MNCTEFRKSWNARLDDPAALAIDSSEALDAHASACAPCRRLAAGFRLMASPLPPPAVPYGLADRAVDAWSLSDDRARRIPRLAQRGRVMGWATAAAVLVILVPPSGRMGREPMLPGVPPPAPAARPWTTALAEATAATLDLAREASAPAARIGQDVLLAGRSADVSWPVAIERPAAPSEMLESMSRSVNSSVRPLTGSARRAFSFLIAPGRGAAKADSGA